MTVKNLHTYEYIEVCMFHHNFGTPGAILAKLTMLELRAENENFRNKRHLAPITAGVGRADIKIIRNDRYCTNEATNE